MFAGSGAETSTTVIGITAHVTLKMTLKSPTTRHFFSTQSCTYVYPLLRRGLHL